jgi:hypothetical protein
MAGWPLAQEGNKEGDKLLQHFRMGYIGTETITNDAGEDENVILGVVDKDNDDAVCSHGASGSEAFILQEVKTSTGETQLIPKPIGVLSVATYLKSVYDEANPDPQQLQSSLDYYKQAYPWYKNWESAGAVCGIAYKTPDNTNGYTQVQVVDSASEIPNPQVTNEAVAQDLFWNIGYKSKIINGIAIINNPASSEGKGNPDNNIVIERPVIFANQDGSLAVCYDSSSNLGCQILPDTSSITVFPYNQSSPPAVIESSGVKSMTDPNTQNNGSFINTTGLTFGTELKAAPEQSALGQPYTLEIQNGQVAFIAS